MFKMFHFYNVSVYIDLTQNKILCALVIKVLEYEQVDYKVWAVIHHNDPLVRHSMKNELYGCQRTNISSLQELEMQ